MNDEARNSLSAIRGSLYGYHTALSKGDALKNLERLANKKIPAAMHLLGHALWEVVRFGGRRPGVRSYLRSCCYGVAFCDGFSRCNVHGGSRMQEEF